MLDQKHHWKCHKRGHGDEGKPPDLSQVEERAGHHPGRDEDNRGVECEGMAREVFSLLRHTIKTIKECEWLATGWSRCETIIFPCFQQIFNVMMRKDGTRNVSRAFSFPAIQIVLVFRERIRVDFR